MSNIRVRRVRAQTGVLLLLACCVSLVAASIGAGEAGAKKSPGVGARLLRVQEGRTDIRLRSFAPNASGQLSIEPSAEGGRGRLTALGLPDPRTQSRDARTYVVWANSDGRIVRLGEMIVDRRGNGGLAFTHPGFERYTVIVTAETSAAAERPLGAPVLSTRAGEATAVFPSTVATPSTTSANVIPRDVNTTQQFKTSSTRPRIAAEGFYSEVEGALDASGGGRAIELDGAELAPRARGQARAAERGGSAYVVVRFSDVPLPSTVGAGAYVMWAILPNGRLVYMGSLPADHSLNQGTTYVRVQGFDTDRFDLFVTAERARPASSPSDQRVLSTRHARNIVR